MELERRMKTPLFPLKALDMVRIRDYDDREYEVWLRYEYVELPGVWIANPIEGEPCSIEVYEWLITHVWVNGSFVRWSHDVHASS